MTVPVAVRPAPGSSTSPLLDVTDLRVQFSGRNNRPVHAVRGLTYHINAGESLGLVGESGSGKSVSALSLLGLLPKKSSRVTAGSAIFEGHDLIGMPDEQMRKVRGARIAMIFQDPLASLNPVLTIGRQITEALETHLAMGKTAANKRAAELLTMVGIPGASERINDYPHQFSGGMRQRAMIAMALSCEPALLIADEPTTALDVTIQAQILDLMRTLRDEFGTAIILITHDLGVVAEMCDRVAVMYAGEIVEQTDVTTLFRDPLHPYTQGLIGSIPVVGAVRDELAVIPGNVPNLIDLPKGCRFAPRCLARVEENVVAALEMHPNLHPLGSGHEVRCWLYHDDRGAVMPRGARGQAAPA